MTPPASFQARISGRVQGVGFRFFVLGTARRLGLTGSVRNRPDGQVEVSAAGDRAALDQLITALHAGPPLSRVDAVELDWDAEVAPETEFVIRGG